MRIYIAGLAWLAWLAWPGKAGWRREEAGRRYMEEEEGGYPVIYQGNQRLSEIYYWKNCVSLKGATLNCDTVARDFEIYQFYEGYLIVGYAEVRYC